MTAYASGPRAAGVASAAVLVTVVTAASRVAGFAREAVIAAVYGAGPDLDAYLVATGVPNVVIALLATVAVTAFIPRVAERVRAGDTEGGHDLFRVVAVGVLGALTAGSVLLALAAPAVVAVMAPGFAADQRVLATGLTRILLLATVLVAGMNLVSGLLQVHRRFFWPAFVGIPFNAVVIVAALLLGRAYGVVVLAWAFVAGSALRVLVQLPALRRERFRLRGPVRWRDPGVRAVATLMPTILLGHLAANVNTLVDRAVGSSLGDGVISALNYAYRLVSLPHGLLVVTLLAVLYPAFGAAAGAAQRGELADLVNRGAGALMVLLVPIMVASLVLARPAVELAYGRGAFTPEDAAATAVALAAYAPGILALGVRDLATRALYGLGDTRAPVVAALAGMAANVAGDLALAPLFGVAGLGAATSGAFAVSAVLAVRALARHDAVAVGSLLAALGRGLAVAPLGLGAMLAVQRVLPSRGTVVLLAEVLAAAVAGAAVHLAALRVLRAPELAELRRSAGAAWQRLRGQGTART